eukprot:gene27901-34685_t
MSSSGAASSTVQAKKPTSSLDSVLDLMNGPKAVSTMAKTSLDWDVYKEQEGIEDELAGAAKEGFLTRKDFLNRCDVRAFESEKDARLAKSATRLK